MVWDSVQGATWAGSVRWPYLAQEGMAVSLLVFHRMARTSCGIGFISGGPGQAPFVGHMSPNRGDMGRPVVPIHVRRWLEKDLFVYGLTLLSDQVLQQR